jgi:hypothetical protein
MKKQLVSTLAAITALPAAVWAQKTPVKDTAIRGATIEVIQSYKPVVKQAPKPEFMPSLPPADTSRPQLSYDVPAQTLYFTYHSIPLRPLALGRDTVSNPFPSYVKLGGGNLSTLYLDAGIAALKGRNYETAIHLHHISQQGDVANQKSSITGGEATGTLHTDKLIWNAGVGVNLYRFNLYSEVDGNNYHPDANMTLLNFSAGAQNAAPNTAGIDYHPEINAYYASGEFSEVNIGFAVPFTKTIDSSLTVALGVNGAFSRISYGDQDIHVGNNIFQLRPGVTYHKNGFYGHVFLNPTLGQNYNKNEVYLLPDVLAAYTLPHSHFTIKAGWQALLHQNRFEQLYMKNQFFAVNNYEFVRFHMQTRSDEVFAGVESNIGSHLSFSGRVSWWAYQNLAMIVNRPVAPAQFQTIYDPSVNALSLQANLRYQVSNSFAIGVGGTWFSYSKKTYDRVWNEPNVRLKADLLFKPVPELTITAYSSILDGLYTLDGSAKEVKLKGILDLGGGAEYQIIPRLGAFVQVNNLLNNHYERWLGYPSYGFNIYGGLRLKF